MNLKKFYKKSAIFFISLILGLFLCSDFALAQATYNNLVAIPGISSGAGVTDYLSGLYTFLVSVVGVVAMGAIVVGGARYLTSAGNPSAVEDAKHTINSAVIGLILALSSWVIVKEINPDILVLKEPAMGLPASVYSGVAKTPQCALPAGDPKIGCGCADAKSSGEKVFGITDPLPPYVANVSSSCMAGISTTDPFTITIVFSELMDPASVGSTTAYTFNPAVIPASYNVDNNGSASIVNINFSAGTLAANTDYTVTIKQSAQRLGSAVTMLGDYVFRFTTNATFATACVPPLTGTGCNRVCSDKSLAKDGNYHCLKVGVGIGWVPDDNPGAYTFDQLRAMAVGSGSADAPYQAVENGVYVIDVEKKSNVINIPATYYTDTNYDGQCKNDGSDGALSGPGGGWANFIAIIPAVIPSPYICKPSKTPDGLSCAQKFCIWDSLGNSAETALYYTILAKP